MRLRRIWGVVALTLVAAVALLSLLAAGAAGDKGKPHNASDKNGRAGFHFLGGTGPPATLVATGTWKAEDVVSWTPGTSHGVYEGGILVIHATVKPNGQPAIRNVLIEVDCNLGPAGFSTGKPEGVVVTVPATPAVVFTPTSPTTGVTVFSLTKGHKH